MIHQILDRILEIGRNQDGMFYNQVNPVTGEILNEGIADTWGYIFNAYLTVYQLDGNEEYLEAIHMAILGLVKNYTSFDWENGSADGYADAIEGALNLLNRIPDQELSEWIDTEIKVMWNMQQPDGIIEGWHGDGNFARTSLMYGLWKTAGLTMKPWETDLKYGSFLNEDTLYIQISTSSDWEGTLYFDCQRHLEFLNLPFDYPRINQFPEWWTIKPDSTYILSDIQTGENQHITGKKLLEGLPLKVEKDKSLLLILSEKPPAK